MRKLGLTIGIFALFILSALSQNLYQTIRGTIIDTDSKLPLIGAEVMIVGSRPILGTVSDVAGTFRLEKVPVGRVSLLISYLGYKNKTIPNLIVNSGKEVVLQLSLEEAVVKMEEIVVEPEKNLFFDYEKAYMDKIEDIFQVDLSVTYRINQPRATHEIFLNLVNLTNNRGKLSEYYNENEPNSVGYITQFGIFPNLLYRVYF